MNITRLRITPNGNVTGLWDDQVDWRSLGSLTVRRASHVEFCRRRQLWHVRGARARNALRAILQIVLRRPFGEILYWSTTREQALAWEREYFSIHGP